MDEKLFELIFSSPTLEDAAEARGTEYMGQKCGTFGEFACLSFNGNKIITTRASFAAIQSLKENRWVKVE
jgi:dTDP-4-amino-4,6-dideoxygalactose transaminase